MSSQPSIISYKLNEEDYIDEDTVARCKQFISLFQEVLTDMANEVVDWDVMFLLLKKEQDWWTLTPERVHELYMSIKGDYLIPDDSKSYR